MFDLFSSQYRGNKQISLFNIAIFVCFAVCSSHPLVLTHQLKVAFSKCQLHSSIITKKAKRKGLSKHPCGHLLKTTNSVLSCPSAQFATLCAKWQRVIPEVKHITVGLIACNIYVGSQQNSFQILGDQPDFESHSAEVGHLRTLDLSEKKLIFLL